MTEPMKTPADFLDNCDPYAEDYNQELVNAMEGYATQQVAQERERIKKDLGKSIIEHEYDLDFPGDPVINVSVLFKLIDSL